MSSTDREQGAAEHEVQGVPHFPGGPVRGERRAAAAGPARAGRVLAARQVFPEPGLLQGLPEELSGPLRDGIAAFETECVSEGGAADFDHQLSDPQCVAHVGHDGQHTKAVEPLEGAEEALQALERVQDEPVPVRAHVASQLALHFRNRFRGFDHFFRVRRKKRMDEFFHSVLKRSKQRRPGGGR